MFDSNDYLTSQIINDQSHLRFPGNPLRLPTVSLLPHSPHRHLRGGDLSGPGHLQGVEDEETRIR